MTKVHISDLILKGSIGRTQIKGAYANRPNDPTFAPFNRFLQPTDLATIKLVGKEGEVCEVCSLGAAYLAGLPTIYIPRGEYFEDIEDDQLFDHITWLNDTQGKTFQEIADILREAYPDAYFEVE